MNAFSDIISQLKEAAKTADIEAQKIVESKPELLASLNRAQLAVGNNALGGDMPRYVSGSKAPQAPNKIKLFDTGKFTEGINPLFSPVGIGMTSTDSKVSFLDPKYPLALGLSPSSIAVIQGVIERELPTKLLGK